MKRTAAANCYVSIYDGLVDMGFECIGAKKCAHAKFYVEPPADDEECAFVRNFTCVNGPARAAALELLKTSIVAELEAL